VKVAADWLESSSPDQVSGNEPDIGWCEYVNPTLPSAPEVVPVIKARVSVLGFTLAFFILAVQWMEREPDTDWGPRNAEQLLEDQEIVPRALPLKFVVVTLLPALESQPWRTTLTVAVSDLPPAEVSGGLNFTTPVPPVHDTVPVAVTGGEPAEAGGTLRRVTAPAAAASTPSLHRCLGVTEPSLMGTPEIRG
jgi:hypothetical protein